MGAYPAQAIINIQVYQSELFREPPLRPSHRLHQLSFLYVLIIARLRWFVKTLFVFFFFFFFNLYCTLTSLRTRQGFVASFISHLGCVPLLYHNLGDLSRGFLHFLRIFFREHLRLCYAHNGKHSSTATLSP